MTTYILKGDKAIVELVETGVAVDREELPEVVREVTNHIVGCKVSI